MCVCVFDTRARTEEISSKLDPVGQVEPLALTIPEVELKHIQ